MPSVSLTDSSPVKILSATPGVGATLQNLSNANMYLRWDGNPTVTATSNTDNSGIRLKKGAYIDIPNIYADVYGIGEPAAGSGLELRYVLRRNS